VLVDLLDHHVLDNSSQSPYNAAMSNPRMSTLDQIKADLAESEDDIAAGRLIPADAVHQTMQDRLDRLEERLSEGINGVAFN
jgi:hypothetical protein